MSAKTKIRSAFREAAFDIAETEARGERIWPGPAGLQQQIFNAHSRLVTENGEYGAAYLGLIENRKLQNRFDDAMPGVLFGFMLSLTYAPYFGIQAARYERKMFSEFEKTTNATDLRNRLKDPSYA